jgi:hypothetical protein
VCRRHRELNLSFDMHETILLKVADITLALSGTAAQMKLHVDGASQKFIVRNAEPDLTLEAKWDDLSRRPLNGDKAFSPDAVWALHRSNGKSIFAFYSSAFGSVPYKIANLEEDLSRGEIALHSRYFNLANSVYPLEFPLDELLFSNILCRGKGVEIHAAGILDGRGRGRLFVGHSGAGKTTMSRLWESKPGVVILSDDRIALRRQDGQIWMHGTPWHGEAGFAAPTRARLDRIYLLAKGAENELAPIDECHAAGRLFSRCFLPLYDPQAVDFTLGFLEHLVTAVPCGELKFVPDGRAVDFIQNTE